ncbi:uncharacterized protein ZBAI_08651 [Zygosaccharomyces bailii ISA1307]|nr:uncharacterized protein ZBAI_08651 [Zygosaccharomyces bailii ISA1307]
MDSHSQITSPNPMCTYLHIGSLVYSFCFQLALNFGKIFETLSLVLDEPNANAERVSTFASVARLSIGGAQQTREENCGASQRLSPWLERELMASHNRQSTPGGKCALLFNLFLLSKIQTQQFSVLMVLRCSTRCPDASHNCFRESRVRVK